MDYTPLMNELLQRTADGGFIVDADQRIVAWNQAAETLLGFRAENIIGQLCYRILGGHTDGGCVVCRRGCQPYTVSMRGDLVPSFDVQVRTKGGSPRWVNASIIAIGPEFGVKAGSGGAFVLHLLRDIEAKKQAESFATDVATWARQLQFQPESFDADEKDLHLTHALTKREFQVLELLAQGASTEVIASQLVIGAATVRNHIQHILNKLGVHSRLEAVTYAREHHLLN